MAEMPGGTGGGWTEYLSRFMKNRGGTGERIGAAVGGDNSEVIGQMYDQLMTPPGVPPTIAPPTMPFQQAAPIQFGQAGGNDPKMMAMLMQLLKQRG
jgi:hypothetical protein